MADCAVAVSDARAAARWWQQSLGFAVHVVGGGDHAVMVAPPGDRFILHLCEGFEPVQPGNSGIAFVTDDIDGLVRRMSAAGVSFPEPLQKEAWGSHAKFSDPDGNIYWLLGASRAFVRKETSRRAPAAVRALVRPAARKHQPRGPRTRR